MFASLPFCGLCRQWDIDHLITILWVMLIVGMLNHNNALTPYGDHSSIVGLASAPRWVPMFGPILEVVWHCSLQVWALIHASDGGPARDSNPQVKTLFLLGTSEMGLVPYLWLLWAPYYSISNLLPPFLNDPTFSYFRGIPWSSVTTSNSSTSPECWLSMNLSGESSSIRHMLSSFCAEL